MKILALGLWTSVSRTKAEVAVVLQKLLSFSWNKKGRLQVSCLWIKTPKVTCLNLALSMCC